MRRTKPTVRLVVAASLVAALTTIAVGAMADPAAAAPPAAAASNTTAPYVVKQGDNFVGIAKKLKVKLADLLAVNQLVATSTIHPGDVLLVPGAAGSAPVPAVASGVPAPAGAPATTYVVQRGDALSAIAAEFGIKLGPLLKANRLKIDSVVLPGRTLIIPAGARWVISPIPAASGQATSQTNATTTATTVTTATTTPVAVSKIETLVAYARAQLGKPYVFNTAGPDTFDCSGLTSAAYAQIGIWLPHQSAMQSTRGTAVDWTTAPIQAGDLIFMYTSDQPTVISHVAVAIDSKRWIHAPRPNDVVRIGMIPAADKIVAVRRYVTG